jgi:hypothetical protein
MRLVAEGEAVRHREREAQLGGCKADLAVEADLGIVLARLHKSSFHFFE